MTAATLRHLFLASLWRRRLPTSLSVLAIALGVALGLAVQLIHRGALDEFQRGVSLLSGQADLQVLAGASGFDDSLFARIAQLPEVAAASPVLEISARLPGRPETLKILGLDVFRIAAVNPSLLPEPATAMPATAINSPKDHQQSDPSAAAEQAEQAPPDLLATLRENALFLSPAAAARLGLEPGDSLTLQAGTQERELRIAGRVPAAGVGQELAVMDIAAAQWQFARIGVLTRIDLRLRDDLPPAHARAAIAAQLPPGLAVLPPAEAAGESLGLTRAYRVNLTMLATIALLTGGFLVFSTQWLAVVRRRQELAFLRALGLTRAKLWRGLLAEGALLGLLGGLLGALLAYLLAALAFAAVGGDLGAGFFRGLNPHLSWQWLATLSYLALGVAAGLAGAWLPAREAARTAPAQALKAGDEAEAYRARPRWGWAAGSALLAALLCTLPPLGGIPVFGYLAVLLILLTAILALPGVTQLIGWLGVDLPFASSPIAQLARARLTGAPGQTVVAGAGVVASVALAASMAVMVDSFRGSVDDWLTRMLPADLYLRASDSSASGFLTPEQVEQVRALPSVRELYPVRFDSLRLDSARPAVSLIARRVDGAGGLPLVAGTLQVPDEAMPPAWVSEALVDQYGLDLGDHLQLPLGGTPRSFTIAGIWRDYARQHGSIVVRMANYRALSGDKLTNDLGLMLRPDAEPEAVMRTVRDILGESVSEMILPGDLRAMILKIFDRTFVVTYLMEGVAVLIGLFGIATTFAALTSSRRKEFGILRHLGLSPRDIGRLLELEAGLGALLAVMVGLVAGGGIAWVLIEVINRQSFHWSMELAVPVVLLATFAAAMILLAAGAARLAGAQAMRQNAVLAVREDW
ncbi:FtsX-like permease family protein [Thiorhodovibrio frisius]|uniref:ABC-type transport system, involved in lipoprotein release, permease component n=1 Tax=Thiorhodovibrio frisius TaxID=631362 RepID=H8Z0V1_9GAMM|nr:ABC transporter permease [Thiorhodovibrio frisius]EIC21333.1 ABC-type transport system, involved in lipoprotein release, permease component [Thiorhodovibrio frisius]WPL23916.1 ABC transporter permease YtrF precursor [Thiorhodovibrio frisius]